MEHTERENGKGEGRSANSKKRKLKTHYVPLHREWGNKYITHIGKHTKDVNGHPVAEGTTGARGMWGGFLREAGSRDNMDTGDISKVNNLLFRAAFKWKATLSGANPETLKVPSITFSQIDPDFACPSCSSDEGKAKWNSLSSFNKFVCAALAKGFSENTFRGAQLIDIQSGSVSADAGGFNVDRSTDDPCFSRVVNHGPYLYSEDLAWRNPDPNWYTGLLFDRSNDSDGFNEYSPGSNPSWDKFCRENRILVYEKHANGKLVEPYYFGDHASCEIRVGPLVAPDFTSKYEDDWYWRLEVQVLLETWHYYTSPIDPDAPSERCGTFQDVWGNIYYQPGAGFIGTAGGWRVFYGDQPYDNYHTCFPVRFPELGLQANALAVAHASITAQLVLKPITHRIKGRKVFSGYNYLKRGFRAHAHVDSFFGDSDSWRPSNPCRKYTNGSSGSCGGCGEFPCEDMHETVEVGPNDTPGGSLDCAPASSPLAKILRGVNKENIEIVKQILTGLSIAVSVTNDENAGMAEVTPD